MVVWLVCFCPCFLLKVCYELFGKEYVSGRYFMFYILSSITFKRRPIILFTLPDNAPNHVIILFTTASSKNIFQVYLLQPHRLHNILFCLSLIKSLAWLNFPWHKNRLPQPCPPAAGGENASTEQTWARHFVYFLNIWKETWKRKPDMMPT